MPRDMFGDIVDPSVKVGTRAWYTVPLSIIVHTAGTRGGCDHPADGRGRASDAALDDGVCCGAAAAPATASSAAAAADGASAPASG